MISLERLRSLHAVEAYGSLHAAADALNVTASAISQQIAKLEREVGEPLLERRGRGVALTDAGQLLTGHAERAFSVLRQAEAALDARRAVVAGEVRIGAFATVMRGLAPQALRSLASDHPQLQVRLQEMEPLEAIELLERGDIDLALAQDWANRPLRVPEGLERAPVYDDIADIALPSDHPLAHHDTVALSDLAGDTWISWREGSICHDWLMLTLRAQGREPRVQHFALEYATQLSLVGAGLGAAVLPRLGRGAVPDNVCVMPVTPSLTRHVYALWRSDAARRTAILAAVAAFKNAGAL
ncbi:MAG TPA: LysR family transcriptional regulator [Gemmatimonas aurantiaca]|uniref:LysR family transcriptional regulator n=2 Tax=Gemmatimonas aurantiaca TaxID=173480 RepID=C1ABX4_GEMAT|nr:LysR family transcriptional regulator [Gemmatimonas aurantiaca]BAH40001.1 LysR family transcriptional regulator [Gemmatimonas aurantiaca T-27]HCT57991.1 LysR family transcriptional regulator [Gemmatimonas aurantiaca]